MTTYCLCEPCRTAYSIRTDSARLAALLRLQYGEYFYPGRAEGFPISVTETGGRFEIRTPQGVRTAQFPLQAIDDILFENTRFDGDIFALHGAAVEWNGTACLFLAATTGGKTTLASYLTSQGFGYITDDCILLERESFRVRPCCTPIHLREGGLEVLRRRRAVPEGLRLLDDGAVKRYVYTPRRRAGRALPLGAIYFIQRTEGENRLLPMTATERITELMKAPVTDYPVNAEYLKFLSRLAKEKCGRLLYSEMDFAAEVMQNG